ncbi:MAG: hypothetical protein H6739_21080 [Alphaproteobacteria bacterium]|nr:hypothetical protein [Alphaproteobacteria bacterium]
MDAGLVIVLVHPLQPGNVGAVARAMANMGLQELVLVDPPAFDLEQARMRAAGGRPMLDRVRIVGTVEEAVADCQLAVGCTARARRWGWPTWDQHELAEQCMESGQRTAVLFGREDSGLGNDALARCQALVRIPTAGLPSLNLAQAVLVVAAALSDAARRRGWMPDEAPRQGKRSGGPTEQRPTDTPLGDTPPPGPAPLGMQRATLVRALDLLDETPYMAGRSREQVAVTLGALLQRAEPTARELEILMGMLSKTRWAVRNAPPAD